MGFRGSPVRIRPSRLGIRSTPPRALDALGEFPCLGGSTTWLHDVGPSERVFGTVVEDIAIGIRLARFACGHHISRAVTWSSWPERGPRLQCVGSSRQWALSSLRIILTHPTSLLDQIASQAGRVAAPARRSRFETSCCPLRSCPSHYPYPPKGFCFSFYGAGGQAILPHSRGRYAKALD